MSTTITSVKPLQMGAKCFKMAPRDFDVISQSTEETLQMKCQHVPSPVQRNWLSAALAGELNDAKRGSFHQSAIVQN